jgi:hypothetical protein
LDTLIESFFDVEEKNIDKQLKSDFNDMEFLMI